MTHEYNSRPNVARETTHEVAPTGHDYPTYECTRCGFTCNTLTDAELHETQMSSMR